jgi:hypothetical protein
MATVETTPITADIEKYPEFIKDFLPDAVPQVTAKFFNDNSIEEMIDDSINQAEVIQVTNQYLVQKNDIDIYISRDVTLARYPNYRKLNLILAGLKDLSYYTKMVNLDMEVENYMSEFEQLVRDALSNLTGIPNEATINSDMTEELTDITLTGTYLENGVAKCEEAIASFKVSYDDTEYKTYIYDAVKMKQTESETNIEFVEKVAALSDYNKPSNDEKTIMTGLGSILAGPTAAADAGMPIIEARAILDPEAAPIGTANSLPPDEGIAASPPPLAVPPVADPFNLPGLGRRGGAKKRKTYKRTVKRAKRSKSKRRSL